MNYLVYDQSGNKLDILQNISSMQWHQKYSTRGQAEIHVMTTDTNRNILKKYNRVVCVELKQSMHIKDVDSDEDKIVIKGYLDNLDERINLQTLKISKIEKGLYTLVNTNKRGLNIETAQEKGLSLSIPNGSETTYQELSDTFEKICGEYNIGFKEHFRETDAVNVIELYQGAIRNSCRFSDRIGNIYGQHYVESYKDYKNYAYVYGQENADGTRSMVEVDMRKPGEPRLELYVDARDLQKESSENKILYTDTEYEQILKNRGIAKIKETQDGSNNLSFETSIDSVAGKLNVDYFLGDVVPAISYLYRVSTYVRISGIKYVEEANRGLKIKLDVNIESQEELL